MSSRERRHLDQYEERLSIYYRDRGVCQACGKPVGIDEFQVAHRIANTRANRKRWGDEVIDSPLNKATTHSGKCNDAMNCGFNPAACALLAQIVGDKRRRNTKRNEVKA